jgi:hypothetical protein
MKTQIKRPKWFEIIFGFIVLIFAGMGAVSIAGICVCVLGFIGKLLWLAWLKGWFLL